MREQGEAQDGGIHGTAAGFHGGDLDADVAGRRADRRVPVRAHHMDGPRVPRPGRGVVMVLERPDTERRGSGQEFRRVRRAAQGRPDRCSSDFQGPHEDVGDEEHP